MLEFGRKLGRKLGSVKLQVGGSNKFFLVFPFIFRLFSSLFYLVLIQKKLFKKKCRDS
jgi:hypothetical protein